MAKQKGIIKIDGTIGDLTFYKSKNGYNVREKGGIEASRIANDPAFARTRENGMEFGASAKAGKVLRDAVRPLLSGINDSSGVSRLMGCMSNIKKFDTTSLRGQRNVAAAIGQAAAKNLLKGFNFNINAPLATVLHKNYTLNSSTGDIKIMNLVPYTDVVSPLGATHVSFSSAWARVDFANGNSDVQFSNVVNLPLNGTPSNILLSPAAVPMGAGTDVYVLQLAFYQEVNGNQYPLNNGAYNVLCVVEVA